MYKILDAEVEAVRSLKLQTQSDFEQGLESYRSGDLATAKAYFEKVLDINTIDKTAKLYLERVEIFNRMRSSCGSDWRMGI